VLRQDQHAAGSRGPQRGGLGDTRDADRLADPVARVRHGHVPQVRRRVTGQDPPTTVGHGPHPGLRGTAVQGGQQADAGGVQPGRGQRAVDRRVQVGRGDVAARPDTHDEVPAAAHPVPAAAAVATTRRASSGRPAQCRCR
jgi:hypothetical protein